MIADLRHRGPDDERFHSDGPFQGGMRRLSINDVEHGRQPLTDESGDVVLLYNGEIYNSPALRRELEAKGHRFATRSDGEVICHLYEEMGESLFERLDGMFAAALWIAKERKLILARDLPGEKPLYYAELPSNCGGGVAFASETRSLRRFPGLDLGYDLQALWDFPTFLWIPEPATAYRGIKALPRGHLLVSDGKGLTLKPYRNRFNPEPLPGDDDASVIAETRRVVEDAVKSRLLSDVPVGSFLSGGLDSSIVATLASRELGRLDTFTIGFEDVADPYHGRADEAVYAEALAGRLGTRHHTLRVTGQTFKDMLPDFCRYADQPFAVSSGLGVLAVSRMAREAGIKVLLTGDGADECFGGYSWYFHLEAGIGGGPAAAPAEGRSVSFQNVGLPLEDRLAALRSYPPPRKAWAWHYYAGEAEKRALFGDAFAEGRESSLRHFEAFRSGPWSALDYIAQDRDLYFPQEMMRKADRMTMGASVEGRIPFAAPSVLAHAAKLKLAHMIRGGDLKFALRRAFADVLPADVVGRPKHGFNVPVDHWLKDDWADLLAQAFAPGSALSRLGWLSRDAEAKAQAMLHDPERLNGHTLFCYVMLGLWLEQER